jgi:methionyl-tRNA formyltransferase
MKVIYMGKNKLSAVEGLKYLLRQGVSVSCVVAPQDSQDLSLEKNLFETAHCLHIPTTTDDYICARLNDRTLDKNCDYSLDNIDLVISFLFWKRIRKPLIELPSIGCVNFHPAPLPDFRGLGGYNFAIYEELTSWGVSAHFVAETIDTGDIIKVQRFEIVPQSETAYSLEQKSQSHLLELFKEVIETLLTGSTLPRIPQGAGRYISKKDFEDLRMISSENTPEEIEKKIRAFWYPPHAGAVINIRGKEYTVVNEKITKEIGKVYSER